MKQKCVNVNENAYIALNAGKDTSAREKIVVTRGRVLKNNTTYIFNMNRMKIAIGTIGGALLGVVSTLAAHAQTVPTVGTSDIAAVGGPILSALVTSFEYSLETFGPPLFFIGAVIAVFFAIYHRVRYGTWL